MKKPTFEEVERAVSAVARAPLSVLHVRGAGRELLIRAARVLSGLSTRQIGERLGLSHTAVERIPACSSAEVATVDRVLDDERFWALNEGDLRTDARVRRYLIRRRER